MHSTEIVSTFSCRCSRQKSFRRKFLSEYIFYLSQRVVALVIKQQHSTEIIMFSIVCHNFAWTFRLFFSFPTTRFSSRSTQPRIAWETWKMVEKFHQSCHQSSKRNEKLAASENERRFSDNFLLISDIWTRIVSESRRERSFYNEMLCFLPVSLQKITCKPIRLLKTASSVGVCRPSSKNNKDSIAIFRSLFNPGEYLFCTHFMVDRPENENRHKFSISFDCEIIHIYSFNSIIL